jgi:hypothetical protein
VFAVFTVIEDTVAARLNVTLIDVLRATSVAPSEGDVAVTLNGGWTAMVTVAVVEPPELVAVTM